MAERDITPEDVEQEHLASIHVGSHWAYVAAVLGGSTLGMLVLIALLGASAT
jgi:hypothetical protein